MKNEADLLSKLLGPYNPWWEDSRTAFSMLPGYHRPIFKRILRELIEVRQIISITGPRRIGKSTLMRQIIKHLINSGIPASNLIYYSMDDPALLRDDIDHDQMFDRLMSYANKLSKTSNGKKTYVFLDEIQRFDRWELFLKKYYDLEYPVRFVVSGSASSPIFRKTQESLLGRVKDFHILPFSFREYIEYQSKDNPGFSSAVDEIHQNGKEIMGFLMDSPNYIGQESVPLPQIKDKTIRTWLDLMLKQYLREGGFPEVWTLTEWERKVDYLFDNQVEKVIFEDLILAAEFRKPEMLKRFYIYLLSVPGQEVNFQSLATKIGIGRANIDKYFPLLEMTNLVRHVEKFSKNPVKVRRGNIKCYLVDLSLRNAVLRLQDSALDDPEILGLYAENLVFNALKKWRGTVDINYFRDQKNEVDFIVHRAGGSYIPIEVKYRKEISKQDLKGVYAFNRKYGKHLSLVVTKRWEDFGDKFDMIAIPLPHFLLLFD